MSPIIRKVYYMGVQQTAASPPLSDFFARLIRGYSRWYDFDSDPEECLSRLSSQENNPAATAPNDDTLTAEVSPSTPVISAALHEEQGAYLLSRKATMWESHSHEFVYFFLLPENQPLTTQFFQTAADASIALGRERVHPDANHIRTDITCLIVATSAEAEALTKLKKWSYRENFKMSLHGWMDGRAVLITPDDIICSKMGSRTGDFIESLLYPDRYKEKNSGFKGWLRKIFR